MTKSGFNSSSALLGAYSVLQSRCCLAHIGYTYGAGQVAQPIISQNHGVGKNDRIKQCLKYGLYTCVAFGIMWTALAEIYPNMFVHFFMEPTEAVLEIAPAIIRAYSLSFVILPFNIFSTYYFQAIMKPNISIVVSISRGVIISGIMVMIMPVVLGANSIWFAMLITEFIVAVFSLWQMIKCTKRLK